MKHRHSSSSRRAIKLVSLTLCLSLIATAVTPLSTAGAKKSGSGDSSSRLMAQSGWLSFPGRALGSFLALFQGGGLPNVPGTGLPDLDATRQIQFAEPVAPAAIPSNQACSDCEPCPTCGPGTSNHPPVVNAGGPYYGTAGTGMIFNGLKSFDVDPHDAIDYSWNFGDGTTIGGGMPLHTYQAPGNYTISLTVTDNHSGTSSTTTTASITAAPASIPPSGTTQGNAALFISQSVPTTMTAGQTYSVSVTMRNTGTTTWTAAHLYRLGSQSPQDNGTWGRARVFLPGAVAPGADVTFNFTVASPHNGTLHPAPANFQWRMVQDGVGWIGEPTSNQPVNITGNYQPGYTVAPESNPRSDLFNARLAPQNRTGRSGDDLLSRNFHWGTSLVDLAGRAGLNLNLGLSYNSLAIWTRTVSPNSKDISESPVTALTFDADRAFQFAGLPGTFTLAYETRLPAR